MYRSIVSVVRNPLLILGNHLRFCQHPQCSATQLLRNDLVNVKMIFLFRTVCCNDALCGLDACPSTASSQILLLGVSAPSENPARPSHNQQWRQQPHVYVTIRMISLSVDLFLSADSLDGFTWNVEKANRFWVDQPVSPYWALGWLNSDRDAKRDTTWSERFESGHVHSPFYYEWSSHNLNLWNFLCDLPFLYSMMFCVMQGFFRSNWMSGRSKARKPNRIMNFSMSWVGLMLDSLRPIVIMVNPTQDSVKNCHHFLVPMSWSECPTIFHIKGQSNFFSDPFHFGTGASPWWGSAIHVQPLRTCKGALHVLHQFVRWPLALWVRNSGQYRALHRDVGGDARFSPIDVQKTHHNVVVTSEANMRTAIVTIQSL